MTSVELWFPDVVTRVCTLLYAGSSVLQTEMSPVCSLDKVPQALACDWLLACLQVTFPSCKPHQSTDQLDVTDSVNQAAKCCFLSFEERASSRTHFKSCVIDGV